MTIDALFLTFAYACLAFGTAGLAASLAQLVRSPWADRLADRVFRLKEK